jgi:hypothetical protein
MRRYAGILFISVAALVVCGAVAAQKQPKPVAQASKAEAAPLKENATLEETLSWLNDNLVRYGRFTVYQPLYEPGYRIRTRFLGLEAQGCVVTYRVKGDILRGGDGNVIHEPNSDVMRGPNGDAIRTANGDVVHTRNNWKPSSGAGDPNVDVRTVDLAALDPTLVKGNTPKKWDGGSVLFGAGRGKAAVRFTDRHGKLMEYDGGEFYVSEKDRVEAIADALRHAVALCKQ